MKAIVWGTGKAIEKICNFLVFHYIECFVDSNERNRMRGRLYDKDIISPEEIIKYEYDYIVVGSTKYWEEIAHSCIFEYGIDCAKIISLNMFLKLSGLKKIQDANYLLAENRCKRYMRQNTYSYCIKALFDRVVDIDGLQSVFNCQGYIFPFSNNDQSKMTIFQVGHKPFIPIGNKGYFPIGVGSYTTAIFNDYSGINISYLNSVINECTAIYWIWKNYRSDYIGINHYRRVFESEINKSWPLQIPEAHSILDMADIIVAEPISLGIYSIPDVLAIQVIKEAFENSFCLLKSIIAKSDKETIEAFNKVMENGILYPCNMFIMRWELFDDYCQWLFKIILPMTNKLDIKQQWDNYSKRIIGFWAERLLTVWLYKKGLSIYELPILLLDDKGPFGVEG